MGTLWAVFLLIQLGSSGTCDWGNPAEAGTLDPVVNESSGMAISRKFPNRSYRNNDSGDTGRFFVMDLGGGSIRSVTISGFDPVDNEDMALGPCSASVDCLFIGDIGDNGRRRMDLELVVVEERREFPAEVAPTYRVRLRYPDGPHDAESLAVHPDGTVYIVTKDPEGSQIFRLRPQQWRRSTTEPQTLEPVVKLDWAALRPNTLPFTRLATAMDISPDGKRFLILNYADATEFFLDLSAAIPDPAGWKEGQHYRKVNLTTLEQEEAIAYLPDGKGFLYDTERTLNARSARIMKVVCGN